MLDVLRARPEWKLFASLRRADAQLGVAWWLALLLRGILPADFAVVMGVLVGAVQRGQPLATPLALTGLVFVLLQVLGPVHETIETLGPSRG